jgi:hypothetical protein
MMTVSEGQCGLCRHFGEHVNLGQQERQRIVQIRTTRKAPEDLTEECGHPQHEPLHLVVTPVSGCQGFAPAPMAN